MAERLVGYSQLQARFRALAGPQKMRLMATVAAGELRRDTPRRTGLTGNSWQVASAAESSAVVSGSIVNLFAETRLNHHCVAEGGLLAQECGALLSAFFAARRSKTAFA